MNKYYLILVSGIFFTTPYTFATDSNTNYNTDYRIESDSLGSIQVPKDRYYGAQTQRALTNFSIGIERFPREFIRAYGIVKKAAAVVNNAYGYLPDNITPAIIKACDEVIGGSLDDHFPVVIWQAAGTQSNMNTNEVIANRAIQLLGGEMGSKNPVHPNDHVNMGQSTNDTFPTAGAIAIVETTAHKLLPALNHLKNTFEKKAQEFKTIIKIGRTHLQDAVPMSLGQEFDCFASQIAHGIKQLEHALNHCYELPIGGTAVGTGITTYAGFDQAAVREINEITHLQFVVAENKFEGISAHDGLVELSGALKVIAVSFSKIANDIRLLASGPRAGIGEIILPKNEPGSSIMPGKINPTQSDAATMLCARIIGNDVSVSWLGAHGHLQLNVCGPLMTFATLQSCSLLADMCRSFADKAVAGIVPNHTRIKLHLQNSLMLVTAIVPRIGYDKAATAALKAWNEDKTLKEAIVELGYMSAQEFDQAINYEDMIQPKLGSRSQGPADFIYLNGDEID